MPELVTVAVDAMGGDHGPAITVGAALDCLQSIPRLQLSLIGDLAAINRNLARNLGESVLSRLNTVEAAAQAPDQEPPAQVLRKQGTSLHVAMQMVQSGQAAACVSAGDSGSLMALGNSLLKNLPGIRRPAICAMIPGLDDQCSYLLDAGANVDCNAEAMRQFAWMGSIMARALGAGDRPGVALLNIGTEPGKGGRQIQQAATLLAADSGLNYLGFVEARDLFRAKAEVIVCDGLIGNIAIKSCEATAQLVVEHGNALLRTDPWLRLFNLLTRKSLTGVIQSVDPATYNGACLLGLKGIVVKSHGSSRREDFRQAIQRAYQAAVFGLDRVLNERLEELATG